MSDQRPLRRASTAAAVAVALVLTAACDGGDAGGTSGPRADLPGTSGWTLEALPRLPRMVAVSDPDETEAGTVQSFVVDLVAPSQAMAQYAELLVGWAAVEPPAPFGNRAYKGIWSRDDVRLTVTTAPAPTAGVDGEAGPPPASRDPSSQLTLRLEGSSA